MILYGLGYGDLYTAFFVTHYFYGNGKTIQLRDIGLDDDFENATSVKNQVNNYISQNCSSNNQVTKAPIKGGADVTWVPGLFAVGGISLFAQTSCSYNDCIFTFSIHDLFSDPWDGEDIFNYAYELPGGKTYYVDHQFEVQQTCQ